MARPRTKPLEVRRRGILDAARCVLLRTEYQDLNLDEVARRAGVAKGTLYLYFKDKDALLAGVFSDMLEGAERRFRKLAPAADGSLASLRWIAVDGLDFMDETHYFLAAFSPGIKVLHGSRAEPHGRLIDRSLDLIAGHLKACMRTGLLRQREPRDAALLWGSLMQMLLNRKFMRGSKTPLREQAPELIELFLHGLGGRRAKP